MSFEKPKRLLGLVRDKVYTPVMEKAHEATGVVLGVLAVHRAVTGVNTAVNNLRKKVNKDASR